MTYASASVNPHYAARLRRSSPSRPPEPDGPIYARLPRAPITGSPVPHLTSPSTGSPNLEQTSFIVPSHPRPEFSPPSV